MMSNPQPIVIRIIKTTQIHSNELQSLILTTVHPNPPLSNQERTLRTLRSQCHPLVKSDVHYMYSVPYIKHIDFPDDAYRLRDC